MLAFAVRLSVALLGAAVSTAIVALFEARGISATLIASGEGSVSFGSLVMADLGVLAPVPLAIAGAAGALLAIERSAGAPLANEVKAGRANPSTRLRVSAIVPLFVLAFYGWVIGSAHVARGGFGWTITTPAAVGLGIGIGSVALGLALFFVCLALLPVMMRLLAKVDPLAHGFVDPWATGSSALLCIAALTIVGVGTGDSGGRGGAFGVGILAVLTRPELDLRPVGELLFVLAGSYAASVLVMGRNLPRIIALASGAVSAFTLLVFAILCARTSSSLDASPAIAEAVARGAPVGGAMLGVLRKFSDHDHDGYAAHFGGGDCDDTNAQVNPGAIDIPGNGIDEDCSGADTPAPAREVVPERVKVAVKRSRRTYNVILITVDTLRADLGFAGYPKPVTPNIDALAAKATVFERAYSMASYTAKSVGPTMIGKYPSETIRDWDHFTTYSPANTFLAKRVKAAGHKTIGGMCHYYFSWNTGYNQGFEVWDTSAIPPGMADNDTSITSDRMTDLATTLLGKPANTELGNKDDGEPRRFFSWFHYFDPHLQYVRHPGSPDFRSMPGPGPSLRAGYDEEVWFTDQWIGKFFDFIASKPWAADTAIILTADHGEAFGEHGIIGHGREIWEPLIRVPLVIYVPGAPPHRVGAKRSHIDLNPTVLDLMGVPPPPEGELRGESLVDDVFAGPETAAIERDVYVDMPEGPYNGIRRALITGKSPGMKLLHFGGSRYHLYDLATDPEEKNDLSRDKETFDPVLGRFNNLRSHLKEIVVSGEKRN